MTTARELIRDMTAQETRYRDLSGEAFNEATTEKSRTNGQHTPRRRAAEERGHYYRGKADAYAELLARVQVKES